MADAARQADQDFTRVCSWCGRVVYQGRAGVLTHGICTRCLTDARFLQPKPSRRPEPADDDPAADLPPDPRDAGKTR